MDISESQRPELELRAHVFPSEFLHVRKRTIEESPVHRCMLDRLGCMMVGILTRNGATSCGVTVVTASVQIGWYHGPVAKDEQWGRGGS